MRRFAFALAFALAAGTAAAAEFSTLEERMTASEFKNAGLDKLSPQELERLNAWLKAHGLSAGARGAAAAPADNVGFQPRNLLSATDAGPITAHIVGEFKGWNGSSHFKLDNGQEWAQTDHTELVVSKPIQSPQVTIEQGFLGGWMLKVEGYNRTTRVTRVK
jgi:hypothetical protein